MWVMLQVPKIKIPDTRLGIMKINSALLTTPTSYTVSNFYPGIENTIEIPIIGGVLSHQQNFRVNESGNLQYIWR